MTVKKVSGYIVLRRDPGSQWAARGEGIVKIMIRFEGEMLSLVDGDLDMVDDYIPTSATELGIDFGKQCWLQMLPDEMEVIDVTECS